MRIAIGSDHAGFRLKEHLISVLHDGSHDLLQNGVLRFRRLNAGGRRITRQPIR